MVTSPPASPAASVPSVASLPSVGSESSAVATCDAILDTFARLSRAPLGMPTDSDVEEEYRALLNDVKQDSSSRSSSIDSFMFGHPPPHLLGTVPPLSRFRRHFWRGCRSGKGGGEMIPCRGHAKVTPLREEKNISMGTEGTTVLPGKVCSPSRLARSWEADAQRAGRSTCDGVPPDDGVPRRSTLGQ
eukprot:TRINITY_DN16557_c0_g1_i1.p1 TRINITY_DN16557_c0_g1~~TRINITY_DN16557_c0_g1_i1.p1  ORF type:complete len:204 (-),score=9.57 TRINITY_DN16557_c0_g1_i1:183-746(-)